MTQPTFTFHYGPRLIAGAGTSDRLTDLISAQRILFVTDGGITKLGLAEPALRALAEAGVEVTLFDAVEADPSRATLEAVAAAGRDAQVEAVIGFGGGSPMDVAKLAAYLLGSGDNLDNIWGVGKATGKGLPLILVPTTAGTGSEATPVAIITLPGDEKRGVSSAALIADYAVLDSNLTLGLPKAVTAATAIDAMVHAIEAYTSKRLKNPLSDMLAAKALHLLSGNFRTVCDDPRNLAAREAVLLGAHLAGVAFSNAPVAGVHALAYPLGGRFHVPHGLSNALMLPHVLEHNMDAAHGLYAELAPYVGAIDADPQANRRDGGLVAALSDFAAYAGVPRSLREVGVSESDLDWLASEAMKQERLLQNNPCPISEADARRIYGAAL